ncbi:hypothetical protein H6A11_08845, partial [Bifidobacterium pullorum subsp. saeculare]|uniref:hypothetical protein n=1 Tax=Bifidobacterium pullorum TaxID=78448 RepID=UPI0019578DA3
NMDKYITQDKIKVILENAPQGVDKAALLKKYASSGYKIEGYNAPTQAPVVQKPDYASRVGTDYASAGKDIISGIKQVAQ